MDTTLRTQMIELITAYLARCDGINHPVSVFDVSRIVGQRFGKRGARYVRHVLAYMAEQGVVTTEPMKLTRYRLAK
jgi:hypothetical protein